MDIKNAWKIKLSESRVIGAALIVLIIVISQSIFSTPVKKEKKTQKKDMQTGFLIDDSQMTKLSNEESQTLITKWSGRTALIRMRQRQIVIKLKRPSKKAKYRLPTLLHKSSSSRRS